MIVRRILPLGTLADMERLAKEAEEGEGYTMNADVTSDTEEWHVRKRSKTDDNQQRTGE